MPLKSGLSLTSYAIVNGALTSLHEVGHDIESLSFSTIAPGGFGDLKCQLKVPSLGTIPPDQRIFANVAVTSGDDCVWLGRWDEPGWTGDGSSDDGEYLDFAALGASSCLQDDPQDAAYVTHTAQYIINDQIVTVRGAYIPIDQDMSAVLPDNPSATFTRGYNSQTIEQILNDLLLGLGDYTWGVWNHGRNKDVAGFPTWQLYVHQRNPSPQVANYMAVEADIQKRDIRPSVEYCYNAVTLKYKDSTSLQPTSITVTDARLNGNKTQGSAPFPYRKYVKDLSSLLLSSAQATTLANALLTQYQNGGYKIQVTLTGVRDGSGNPIELWRVRADQNIYLPTISLSQATLPTNVSLNNNLFYITETHYDESGGKDAIPTLTVTCSTFTDTAAFQIARLQYDQDAQNANSKSAGIIQQAGVAELGKCGARFKAATGGDTFSVPVNFKTTMTNVPTINLTQTVTPVNVASFTAVDIQRSGFQLELSATAAGDCKWYGTYTTVGN